MKNEHKTEETDEEEADREGKIDEAIEARYHIHR